MERKSPGWAAIFSFLLPGAGQVYNGDFLRAAFWLVLTLGTWIGSSGLFGWIFHLICAYTAYSRAVELNRKLDEQRFLHARQV